MKDSSSGKCYTCTDYEYSAAHNECVIDRRPKQITGFLLSFFLSYVGAANFYIERYHLGKKMPLTVADLGLVKRGFKT